MASGSMKMVISWLVLCDIDLFPASTPTRSESLTHPQQSTWMVVGSLTPCNRLLSYNHIRKKPMYSKGIGADWYTTMLTAFVYSRQVPLFAKLILKLDLEIKLSTDLTSLPPPPFGPSH